MLCTKRLFLFIFFTMVISLLSLSPYGAEHQVTKLKNVKDISPVSAADQTPSYPSMPEPGKRVPIGDDSYFIYSFNKKPRLGTLIMKVQIYTAEGKKCTSLVIKADSGMPSMRGAHETGDRSFVLSEKGDYLLPANIMMPGDWEIRLTIIKDGKAIFRGRYNFDV